MITRLKSLRDHIRYHSAPRPSSPWSRAIDIAFILTFLLSAPAALIADFVHMEQRGAMVILGSLARSADGRIVAWPLNPQSSRTTGERTDTIIGNFNISVTDHRHGWPLVTRIERQPACLNMDIVAEARPRTDVPRDPADPHQRAVERALDLDGAEEALAAWNQPGPKRRVQWWALFPAAGAWWLMMFFGAAFVIQFLRLASFMVMRKRLERRARRQAEGRCVACGYDLTGLEFNERCPECGSIVW